MFADSDSPPADASEPTDLDPLAIAKELVTLPDGTRVKLRAIRASDAHELRAAFHRLSPESRYRRFLSGAPALSDDALAYLTNVDGVDHVAIVALHETLDLKEEQIVGVGRWVRLKGEPEVAECAVTVVDELQNRGLGKALSERLRAAALARGVRKFRAEVLVSNAPMRHILEDVGAHTLEESGETIVFDVDLPDAHSTGEATSVSKLLSAAASSRLVFKRRLPALDEIATEPASS